MKRLLIVLLLVVLGIGGLGLYRGWWAVASGGSGDRNLPAVSVDRDKIRSDEGKAKDEVRHEGQKLQNQVEAVKRKAGE